MNPIIMSLMIYFEFMFIQREHPSWRSGGSYAFAS